MLRNDVEKNACRAARCLATSLPTANCSRGDTYRCRELPLTQPDFIADRFDIDNLGPMDNSADLFPRGMFKGFVQPSLYAFECFTHD